MSRLAAAASLLIAIFLGGCETARPVGEAARSVPAHEARPTGQATEGMRQGLMGKEATIPYSDTLTYPEDWVEKTHQRTR